MSSDIKIFINDKECKAKKGETLLNVARDNGINIPTLCDLKKLIPTGACRMCVVEEEDGNVIASCKSIVNNSARFYTNTPRLQRYRNQIMSFLCINHPLECGVCDKSGECELQDKVLESKVDIQPFFAIQKQNDYVSFHNKVYNESLCIMCERCARTCNEFVGNNVLKVLSGGFHSKIGVNFDAYCEDCDECVSVCPTGAMFSSRFTYTSNAWELEKSESYCLHCSLRCELEYEVKHNIDSKKEVYRIKNKAHINQLCHAGRHNFMRQNPFSPTFLNMCNEYSNKKVFNISSILDKIDAIRISPNVTNEEAYIANMLAEKSNKKLYCNEAFLYREFCNIANIKQAPDIDRVIDMQNNIVIVLGSYLYDEMPILRSNLSKNSLKKGSKNIWISTIAEERFKSDLSLKYEVGTELGISALLLNIFSDDLVKSLSVVNAESKKHISDVIAWLQSLDLGNVIAESNVSGHELQYLKTLCLQTYSIVKPDHSTQDNKSNVCILIGQDFYLSPHYHIIAQIFGCLTNLCNVSIVPLAYHNINGIQAICNLDYDNMEFKSVLGIRCNAEYSISVAPYAPFAMPTDSDDSSSKDCNSQKHCYILPLQFMEGSVIDINYRLTKLHPSYVDDGFGGINSNLTQGLSYNSPNIDLLDICGEYLGLTEEYIVDLTRKLPFVLESNDKNCYTMVNLIDTAFDDLDSKVCCNRDFGFVETRDYIPYPEIEFIEGSGIFIYKASISGNLSFYSNEYYKDDVSHGIIKVSNQFCIATRLQDNDIVTLQVGRYALRLKVVLTSFLKGMVAVLVSDSVIDTQKYFDYKRLKA